MKSCTECGKKITDNYNICYSCKVNRKNNYNSTASYNSAKYKACSLCGKRMLNNPKYSSCYSCNLIEREKERTYNVSSNSTGEQGYRFPFSQDGHNFTLVEENFNFTIVADNEYSYDINKDILNDFIVKALYHKDYFLEIPGETFKFDLTDIFPLLKLTYTIRRYESEGKEVWTFSEYNKKVSNPINNSETAGEEAETEEYFYE